MGVYKFMAYWIYDVPDHLKTQEMRNEVLSTYPPIAPPWSTSLITLTPKKCVKKQLKINSWALEYIPDHKHKKYVIKQ